MEQENKPTLTNSVQEEGSEHTEKQYDSSTETAEAPPTPQKLFEKNLQLFLTDLRSPESEVDRTGLADLIEQYFLKPENVRYKNSPSGEDWRNTAWNIDKIVASWNSERGLEIYPQFATEEVDLKHIIQHETGHAIIESGLLHEDRKALYREISQIPQELHSQYIQNLIGVKNEQGMQKFNKKTIMSEAIPEIITAWMESDGTPIDMMRQYMKLGNDGWAKVLESQGLSNPEELPQLKNFENICNILNKSLSEKTGQSMLEIIQKFNIEGQDFYDDETLGQSYWSGAEQSSSGAGGPINFIDILKNWMFKT